MFHKRPLSVIVVLAMVTISPGTACSGQIDGPVEAEIVRIIDGDTVLVDAMPWPDQRISTYVRLRGIDAPEMKSKCPAFRQAAKRAKDELVNLMKDQQIISLTAISGDKYFGRVVADITLSNGSRPAEALLSGGLAEPYSGRAKHRRPCPDS